MTSTAAATDLLEVALPLARSGREKMRDARKAWNLGSRLDVEANAAREAKEREHEARDLG